MLVPLILSKGYSLDKFLWNEWFKRVHEQYAMDVKIRGVDDRPGLFEVKIEIAILGVPFIRGLFAFAPTDSNKAVYYIKDSELAQVYMWLHGAFDLEVVNRAAPLLDYTRRMGLTYAQPEQLSDINEYYYSQLDKLNIAQAHENYENMSGLEVPDPKTYNKFAQAIQDLSMPFDETYEEGDDDELDDRRLRD